VPRRNSERGAANPSGRPQTSGQGARFSWNTQTVSFNAPENEWTINGYWGPSSQAGHCTLKSSTCEQGDTHTTIYAPPPNSFPPEGLTSWPTDCGECQETTYMESSITLSPSCATCIQNCDRFYTVETDDFGNCSCTPCWGTGCARNRKLEKSLRDLAWDRLDIPKIRFVSLTDKPSEGEKTK
jgi:hypothetical protein